jgi:YD repeat-containing protein
VTHLLPPLARGRRTESCLGTPDFGDDSSCEQTRIYTWTAASRLESETLDDAFTTTWTYDIRGQLAVVEHPNTTEEEHLYDRAGRLSRHTDESGLVSTWAYDGLGRLESERLPGMASARTVTYAHGLSPSLADAGGDGLEEHTLTEPDGGVWTTLYDFAGRPVWQDFPDATAEQHLYEGPRLYRTVYWDCAGSTCAEEAAEERYYDGLGRLHEVWGPSAPVLPGFGEALTRTTWSDAGRQLRIEDGLGQGTDFDWEDGLLVEEHVEGVYRKTFVTEGLAPL